MKWIKTLPLALVITFCATAASAGVARVDLTAMWLQGEDLDAAQELEARPADRETRISVWHDREEDDPYQRGEPLRLYFRANTDAYVVVYKIDADGYVDVLWPTSRFDDGFAYGGHVYTLPPKNAQKPLRVSNSQGVEYVEAIASQYPFDLRQLGIDFRFDPEDAGDFRYAVAGDPFLAVNDINYAITGLEEDVEYIVTDWAHLYVDKQVEHARYACKQCHTQDEAYHPYVDTCTQVTVYRDWGWHRNWYASFGWYPLYCDPPYYYWDLAYSRPYVNWYYPVYYSWPGYRCYTRPYQVYWWNDSPHYAGDYRVRYRRGGARSQPLYEGRVRDGRGGRRGVPSSIRIADARTVDQSLDRRQVVRGAPPVRVASDRARSAEVISTGTRPRDEDRRVGVRTSAPRPDRGQVSLRPSGRAPSDRISGGTTNVAPQSTRDNGGRRWTKPVVRNRDNGSAVNRPDRVTSPPRIEVTPRAQPEVKQPTRTAPTRTVKPKPRTETKSRATVKRDTKREGKGGGNIQRSSPSTVQRSQPVQRPARTVKKPAPRPSTRSVRPSTPPRSNRTSAPSIKRSAPSRPAPKSTVKRSSGSSTQRSSGTTSRSRGGGKTSSRSKSGKGGKG